ncbi:fimbrial protein [Proteus cibi]|uniref:fimbrial protein n=1 Tax=Proteus cibi TaxID=2050966 RepID=UPI0032DA5610
MKPIIKNSLALMLLLLPVAEVMAEGPPAEKVVYCQKELPMRTTNVNVGGSVNIGVNQPIGATFYVGHILLTDGGHYNFSCGVKYLDDTIKYYYVWNEISKLISVSGAPISGASIPSNVYQTSLPGVGVRFYIKQRPNQSLKVGEPALMDGNVVYELSRATIPNKNSMSMTYLTTPHLTFALIKTGPITPGIATFTADHKVIMNFPNTSHDRVVAPEFPLDSVETLITGAVSITASTCQTPDRTVYLGSFPTNNFPSIGDASQWVDSTVQLTNCPAFRGFYAGNPPIFSTEKKQNFPTPNKNALWFTVSPNNPIVGDAQNGIMQINDEPSSAKGIGIQLAHSQSGTDLVTFHKPRVLVQPISDVQTNVTIPLYARYIRTDERLTSGTANGSLTYMIEYY